MEQLDIDDMSCNTNKRITHFFFFLLIVRWIQEEAKRHRQKL